MKSIILLALLAFSSIVNGQTYKPILNNINEWQFTLCNSAGCREDIYFTDGDTTSYGYNYKVLNGFHFISRTFWLREDSLNQKVYLSYITGTRKEALLYDFSLQVGDSMDIKNPISPFVSNAGYYMVDSINMDQLQDGNNYRHFYLSPTSSNILSTNVAEWVEGVGSLSLINAPGGNPDVNDIGKLSCFFKDEIIFYTNLDSTSDCIPTITNVFEENSNYTPINVFPSLIDNVCHITGINTMKAILIYDINGKKLMSKSIENKSQLDLPMQEFNSGIYFIVLSDLKQDRSSFKIIKK